MEDAFQHVRCTDGTKAAPTGGALPGGRGPRGRLPSVREKPGKKAFKKYPIGYFHIDIAEVRTEEGKLYLFVAIDRTSKFAYAKLHEKHPRRVAADFLRRLIEATPSRLHTV